MAGVSANPIKKNCFSTAPWLPWWYTLIIELSARTALSIWNGEEEKVGLFWQLNLENCHHYSRRAC